MSIINNLGDNLTVTLNSANNYSTRLSLFPEILNQSYFRVLSNLNTIVNCDFTNTTYYIDSTGQLTRKKQILVGDPLIWYPCVNKKIKDSEISIDSDFQPENSQPVSLVFQFVQQIPDQYIQQF